MGLWGDLWLENTVSESLCPWPDISGSSDGRDPVKCERDSLRFPTRASYWPQGRQRVSRWRPAGLLFSPRSGLLKSFLRQEGPQTQLEWPTRHTAETSQLSSSSMREHLPGSITASVERVCSSEMSGCEQLQSLIQQSFPETLLDVRDSLGL